MDDPNGDLLIIGAVASAVVQTCKRFGVPPDLYGPILIVVGGLLGGALAYTRTGTADLTAGAVAGVVAALAAGGVYSTTAAMVKSKTTRPRDARGRFVKVTHKETLE